MVEVAPKGSRSIIYPSPKYKLTRMTVPVQRLCVYLPIEEQEAQRSTPEVSIPVTDDATEAAAEAAQPLASHSEMEGQVSVPASTGASSACDSSTQ